MACAQDGSALRNSTLKTYKRSFDPEAARALQGQLGPDLHQEIELDRAPVLELEVPDGRIGDGLERLRGPGGLPALADHFLEHALTDSVAEALAGAFPGRKPGRRARWT